MLKVLLEFKKNESCFPLRGLILWNSEIKVSNQDKSKKSVEKFLIKFTLLLCSLKAEWMYSQSKGRTFGLGQHKELVDYLVQVIFVNYYSLLIMYKK